ncbi:MAG TPA: hypothetical protein VFU36_18350 [Jatrophihabitans sp.]|nr:hypothetical protein [Jatrophihabitans sp.]
MTSPASHRGRRDNGLDSDAYAPVADVDPRLADHLLDVLGLRDVPAYVEPTNQPVTADRLFVAADQTEVARQVLTELANELGIEVSAGHHAQSARGAEPDRRADPLAGIDTDTEFAAIVAGLGELGRPLLDWHYSSPAEPAEPADEDPTVAEVDHFVPPAPPPVPWPALGTAIAVLVTLAGIAVITFGYAAGLPADLPLPLGVVLVLFGAGLLALRLRPEPRDDSDDDGAVV